MPHATPISAAPAPSGAADSRTRWIALAALSLGILVIMIDVTVVTVALAPIQRDLRLTSMVLSWVMNAYMLAFGCSLIPGGRLGDLIGHRTLCLAGLLMFTGASLGCGLAMTPAVLILSRAAQGVGGALVVAVALPVLLEQFPDRAERGKAVGLYSLVSLAGSSVGLLIGGILISRLGWRWIFMINVPIGLTLCATCLLSAPKYPQNPTEPSRREPWLPLPLLRSRKLIITSSVGVMWAAAASTWSFVFSAYLQLVLGYTPMQVALMYLPANIAMAVCGLGPSAHVVNRWGHKAPLTGGLLCVAAGLALLAHATQHSAAQALVLPGMLAFGIGAGIAYNPLLLAGTADAPRTESGLASGVLNTTIMLGSAAGLSIFAALSSWRADAFVASGLANAGALTGGDHLALLAGAALALLAALTARFVAD